MKKKISLFITHNSVIIFFLNYVGIHFMVAPSSGLDLFMNIGQFLFEFGNNAYFVLIFLVALGLAWVRQTKPN